jgi:anaerobic dimethyl sulfoxide reductase subunit B (iron-sulfur subunit)
MRALDFGDLAELQAKYGTVDAIAPLPEASYTKPSIVITPHWNAQPSGAGTGKIGNLVEEL